MKTNVYRLIRSLTIVVAVTLAAMNVVHAQQNTPPEWKTVEDALGRKGSMQPGDVFKFSMPRSDMKVTVAGTPIKAGLALGSWVAFKKMGSDAIVMGDLVLLESEVEQVKLLRQQR